MFIGINAHIFFPSLDPDFPLPTATKWAHSASFPRHPNWQRAGRYAARNGAKDGCHCTLPNTGLHASRAESTNPDHHIPFAEDGTAAEAVSVPYRAAPRGPWQRSASLWEVLVNGLSGERWLSARSAPGFFTETVQRGTKQCQAHCSAS